MLKNLLLAAEISGGSQISDSKHGHVQIFVADGPERKAANFESNSAARAVVAHLRDLILKLRLGDVVTGAEAHVPTPSIHIAISQQRAHLI